jgi:hypothetical protein
VQGKAERVTDLPALLREFYSGKLAALVRHQEHSRSIRQYDVNNTYQYIVNREEVQLSWIAAAIADLGEAPPEAVAPSQAIAGTGAGGERAILEDDAREAAAFVERWRPRVDAMTNARHAKMMDVVLGEVLEQKRFFEQALAGRTDLLGRRADVLEPARGDVLASRWIE